MEAAKAREIAAAAAARRQQPAGNGKDYSGAYVATGIVCPVRGAVSFIDSWGFPRHQGPHMGVDLMAAAGTPDVAVVSGQRRPTSPAARPASARTCTATTATSTTTSTSRRTKVVPRHVAQGEVIGYVGNTGDAQYTASHTHFEIHPGGGAAVNPYPSVRPVC